MAESIPIQSPSMSRRQLLNFLTGAAIAATATAALYPAAKFFVPPAEGSEDGSLLAKDIRGNLIPASQILAEPAETRALVGGLAGEPTYLTVREDGTLHPWGIVDNCTHLTSCTVVATYRAIYSLWLFVWLLVVTGIGVLFSQANDIMQCFICK